jgi:hypothetical protein
MREIVPSNDLLLVELPFRNIIMLSYYFAKFILLSMVLLHQALRATCNHFAQCEVSSSLYATPMRVSRQIRALFVRRMQLVHNCSNEEKLHHFGRLVPPVKWGFDKV